jgi:hypothetical protein
LLGVAEGSRIMSKCIQWVSGILVCWTAAALLLTPGEPGVLVAADEASTIAGARTKQAQQALGRCQGTACCTIDWQVVPQASHNSGKHYFCPCNGTYRVIDITGNCSITPF